MPGATRGRPERLLMVTRISPLDISSIEVRFYAESALEAELRFYRYIKDWKPQGYDDHSVHPPNRHIGKVEPDIEQVWNSEQTGSHFNENNDNAEPQAEDARDDGNTKSLMGVLKS